MTVIFFHNYEWELFGSAKRINSLAVQVLCRDMGVLEVVFAGSALVLHC